MKAREAVKKAEEYLQEFTHLPIEGAIAVNYTDAGWIVVLELLERKSIPDLMDIIGKYEVRMDAEGELLGYERKSLRKRGDAEEEGA